MYSSAVRSEVIGSVVADGFLFVVGHIVCGGSVFGKCI